MNISSRVRRPSGFGQINQRRHRPDYWLLILSALMLVIGLIVVYAISPALSALKGVSENFYTNKHLIAVTLGVISFAIVANLPIGTWRRLEKPLIIAAATSAVVVRLFGDQVNGAYRWIQIGGFSFQAAELIKLAFLVWLAGFFSDRIRNGELADKDKTFKPLMIAMIVIALVVGIIQKDLGTTGVLIGMMIAMGFIAGMPMKRIALAAGALAIAAVLLILPFSYRRDRLSTFLNPARDCQNTGYQSCQALITVGSGGLLGQGLGRGAQAYGYLPEAANDSIFAIYAEKFGFIGTVALIGLFAGFFTRLKQIIEKSPDSYSRLLVAGILAWLSFQAIINIGAMIGILPLKGITLPFISYGGTSVVFMTAVIGIAFQVSRYTTYGIMKENQHPKEQYGAKQSVEYRARN